MASILCFRMHQKTTDTEYGVVHYETESGIVKRPNGKSVEQTLSECVLMEPVVGTQVPGFNIDATSFAGKSYDEVIADAKRNVDAATLGGLSKDQIIAAVPGYVHPSTKQCSYAYSHPRTKQCDYVYSHPSSQQCSNVNAATLNGYTYTQIMANVKNLISTTKPSGSFIPSESDSSIPASSAIGTRVLIGDSVFFVAHRTTDTVYLIGNGWYVDSRYDDIPFNIGVYYRDCIPSTLKDAGVLKQTENSIDSTCPLFIPSIAHLGMNDNQGTWDFFDGSDSSRRCGAYDTDGSSYYWTSTPYDTTHNYAVSWSGSIWSQASKSSRYHIRVCVGVYRSAFAD